MVVNQVISGALRRADVAATLGCRFLRSECMTTQAAQPAAAAVDVDEVLADLANQKGQKLN